jgi:hypothetical protein
LTSDDDDDDEEAYDSTRGARGARGGRQCAQPASRSLAEGEDSSSDDDDDDDDDEQSPQHTSSSSLTQSPVRAPSRVTGRRQKKVEPTQQHDWILMCLQGGEPHPLVELRLTGCGGSAGVVDERTGAWRRAVCGDACQVAAAERHHAA